MEAFKGAEDALKFLSEEKERMQQEASDPRKYRFFMKKGNSTKVIFLDDLLFPVKEHRYKANGHYNNWETCVRDIEGECPLCEADNRAYLALVTTIIDLTPYEKKDGTQVLASKKLMVVKHGGAEKLLRRQKNLGTLVGKKFELFRSNDPKGEATGTDIDYEKDVELDALKQYAPEGIDPEEWLKPFDYKEIFAPKSVVELRKSIGFADPVGAEQLAAPKQEKQNLGDLL